MTVGYERDHTLESRFTISLSRMLSQRHKPSLCSAILHYMPNWAYNSLHGTKQRGGPVGYTLSKYQPLKRG